MFLFHLEGAVIGRVNPELYALAAGTWNYDEYASGISQNQSAVEEWMLKYINVLCINSWQVKRYIDVYSASSLVGFSEEDLLRLSSMYSKAMERWSNPMASLDLHKDESGDTVLPDLRSQISSHFSFLANVAELSRSKWTEFNLGLMGIGLAMMLISLLVHLHTIRKLDRFYAFYSPSSVKSGVSFGLTFSCLIVVVRACSFLSNSYILEEGKVACFLVATLAILTIRHSVMVKKMLAQAVGFTGLISILRFSIELKLSKLDVSLVLLNICPSWTFGDAEGQLLWTHVAELIPLVSLLALALLLCYALVHKSSGRVLKHVIMGTLLSYVFIAVQWAADSRLLNLPLLLEGIGRKFVPRIIYVIGCAQVSSLLFFPFLSEKNFSNWEDRITIKVVAMLSAWSSTVIILSGRQGVLVALTSIVGGWCIVRSMNLEQDTRKSYCGTSALFLLPVTQWSLLAVCLFFATGHWCAFDGLHYAAPFIGFEEFTLIPQAILLTIETFGFSHILPILGLPFLVAHQHPSGQGEQGKRSFCIKLSLVYSMYGLITATTFTFTMICVTIQRRHLMVWGLFAPKFVFDVVALVLTDALIFLAMLFYGQI